MKIMKHSNEHIQQVEVQVKKLVSNMLIQANKNLVTPFVDFVYENLEAYKKDPNNDTLKKLIDAITLVKEIMLAISNEVMTVAEGLNKIAIQTAEDAVKTGVETANLLTFTGEVMQDVAQEIKKSTDNSGEG